MPAFIRAFLSIVWTGIVFGVGYGVIDETQSLHEGFEIAIAGGILAIGFAGLAAIWAEYT